MPRNESKNLICEACGAEFSCSADSRRCWCFDVKIESQALFEIKKKYGDCLCGKCLTEISAKFNGKDFITEAASL